MAKTLLRAHSLVDASLREVNYLLAGMAIDPSQELQAGTYQLVVDQVWTSLQKVRDQLDEATAIIKECENEK